MHPLTSSLRIFVSGAWLSYLALFSWAEPYRYVVAKTLTPLTHMLFFVVLGTAATGRENAQFYIVGNALQLAALSGVFGLTMVIGGERGEGTLVYLVGSPANRLAIFWGRALFNILDGMLTVVICLAWGILLGLNVMQANLPAVAVTILIATASTCGFGFLMGSLSLASLDVMFVNNAAYFLLLIFSGANIPLDQMPAWMYAISACVPLTRGIQAARLYVNGASLAEGLPLLGGELAVGLIYGLIAFALFRWVEFHARRQGTLEAF